MNGLLYGVGLGPGSADLITIRASRLISTCQVLAYPKPDNCESFARSIAKDIIPPDITEIPIEIPMQEGLFPAHSVYDRVAVDISRHLDAGRDVVTICQGDPLFYGSFMYLFARLSKRHRVEIVPGVSSLTACAAAAGHPLCARHESLCIIPATLDHQDLYDRLAVAESCAIVKVGRHLPKVRSVLADLDLVSRSVLVTHATLPSEQVMALSDAPDNPPYFSTILVAGCSDYAED